MIKILLLVFVFCSENLTALTTHYHHNDSAKRKYIGISVNDGECRGHLKNDVKDNLIDREEWQDSLNRLNALREETGFTPSPELLTDIQALENQEIECQQFRVGEAYTEIILEQEFSCRFHWNENRDARNPKGNKTGADLVGFIEIDGEVLFLFGEVKTSSEVANRPPQVMTSAHGIEAQLRDLYNDKAKRLVLISYLKSKMRHYPVGHQFRSDFDSSFRAYYSGLCDYQLIGVLVRDVEPDVRDLHESYLRLQAQILNPKGIKLLALYLPIVKEEWLGIINEDRQ
jgi:hypothetical protein